MKGKEAAPASPNIEVDWVNDSWPGSLDDNSLARLTQYVQSQVNPDRNSRCTSRVCAQETEAGEPGSHMPVTVAIVDAEHSFYDNRIGPIWLTRIEGEKDGRPLYKLHDNYQ